MRAVTASRGRIQYPCTESESGHGFDGAYKFIRDFKERVDEYQPNLGIVYKDDDPEQKGQHLDQELLICGLTGKGETDIFSLYGLSVQKLKGLFGGLTLFKETEQGSKTFLEFKDDGVKTVFKDEREALIKGYAKLLAFEILFKELSEIYEADLLYRTRYTLMRVGSYIDGHNEALRKAMGLTSPGDSEEDEKITRGIFMHRDVLRMNEDLTINREAIKPDRSVLDEHVEELKRIFGSEFSIP